MIVDPVVQPETAKQVAMIRMMSVDVFMENFAETSAVSHARSALRCDALVRLFHGKLAATITPASNATPALKLII
jgi:hypothetical protein